MITFGYDLGFLQEALNNLEPYLLSEASHWPLGGHHHGQPPYPPLTIESFLLVRQRCQGLDLPPNQADKLEQVELSLKTILHRWRSAWGKKASGGFHHRLNLWNQYIQDLNDDPNNHQDRYSQEVRLRVMLELLRPYADLIPPEELSRLVILDQRLRTSFQPGEFIWSPDLKRAFSEPIFWYLYGLPEANKAIHENFNR